MTPEDIFRYAEVRRDAGGWILSRKDTPDAFEGRLYFLAWLAKSYPEELLLAFKCAGIAANAGVTSRGSPRG